MKEVETIGIYYDSLTSALKYKKNKNLNSYALGNLIGAVVKPPPIFAHCQRPVNYTLIEADDWSNTDGLAKIGFDLSQVMKLDLTDKDNNQRFPVTSYSIFKRGPSSSNIRQYINIE